MATTTKGKRFRQAKSYNESGKTHTPAKPPETVPAHTELRGRAEAPKSVATHCSSADDAKRREVAKREAKERAKSVDAREKAETLARLYVKGTLPKMQLESLNSKQLQKFCQDKQYKGFSGLTHGELVTFIIDGGKKPAPQKDTARDYRERVSALKKAGRIVGPVSSLKAADLKAAVKAADKGEKVSVQKPAPKAGTMEYNKNLLRNHSGKGYQAAYTAQCKKDFGEKTSISSLKADQLKQLVKTLGLS